MSRPGGLERCLIDVRTVDGLCVSASALGGTAGDYRAAEQEKRRRYKGQAHSLAVELGGGSARSGLVLLKNLSWEAATAKPANGSPTRFVSLRCRELALVISFEAAEAHRVAPSDSSWERL